MLAAPASPPDNVNATAISPTEIMVTWDIVPEIDQNGVITRYEVLYVPLETFDGMISSMTVTVLSPNTSVTLTGLEEHVFYNISVRAFTSAGSSDYSTVLQERTFEDGKTLTVH